jgi:two-component system, OmpR family, response regulator
MSPLRRIMCVDDEDDILEVVRLCLEMVGGLEVVCCHGGQEALEQIPVVRPDLILLDVMMPGMDGPATLRQLQTSGAGKDIPIVFMTARIRNLETEEYMRLGASGVVAKPFDPSTLSSDIARIWLGIEEKREQHEVAAAPAIRAPG